VLVLLPKNRRKNNIFQSFIASKTRIKLSKIAYKQAICPKAFFATRCPIKVNWASNHNLILFLCLHPSQLVSEVLGLVHKRSFDKLQHQIIRNIIFKNAYIDKYRGEIVSRV
jgi:hypothetical protein